MKLVLLHPAARLAWPWIPACAPRGSVLVGPSGEVLMVRADGGLDPVIQGGTPAGSIAADPAARPLAVRGG